MKYDLIECPHYCPGCGSRRNNFMTFYLGFKRMTFKLGDAVDHPDGKLPLVETCDCNRTNRGVAVVEKGRIVEVLMDDRNGNRFSLGKAK